LAKSQIGFICLGPISVSKILIVISLRVDFAITRTLGFKNLVNMETLKLFSSLLNRETIALQLGSLIPAYSKVSAKEYIVNHYRYIITHILQEKVTNFILILIY